MSTETTLVTVERAELADDSFELSESGNFTITPQAPARRRISGIVPLTIRKEVAVLPLNQGLIAIVDIADWPLVDGFNWTSQRNASRGYYAYRHDYRNGNKKLYVHRVVAGVQDRRLVDHHNNNGLDNRRQNLRIANSSQNQANRTIRPGRGVKGVYFRRDRGKWRARIVVRGREIFLGSFSNKQEAAAAYDAAALTCFGEFAKVNGDQP